MAQVMMPVLPPHLLAASFAAISADLPTLALPPAANFAVQAALAACTTPDQVRGAHQYTSAGLHPCNSMPSIDCFQA